MDQVKLSALLENEDFTNTLIEKETPAEVVSLFEQNGLTVTEEEVIKLHAMLTKSASGELNEDDLENVAGGSFESAARDLENFGKKVANAVTFGGRRW